MVQQHVIDMPYVRIPLEVIAALVNVDTMVKLAEIVLLKVNVLSNLSYPMCPTPSVISWFGIFIKAWSNEDES